MTDDHLRKLAEAAAGKGAPRWCVRANDEHLVDEAEPGPDDVHECAQNVAEVSTAEEAAYIAAANPQAIIHLLDERDRLARAVEAMQDNTESALDAIQAGEPSAARQLLMEGRQFARDVIAGRREIDDIPM